MSLIKRDSETVNGVTTEWYTDQTSGGLVINKVQDATPILERNKILGEINNGYNEDKSMQLVAEMPETVYLHWEKELIKQGVTDSKERLALILAKLNDPDNAAFRVGKGHLA